MCSDNGHKKELRKLEKADKLLKISTRVNNELRSNIHLANIEKQWNTFSCQKFQEINAKMINGITVDPEVSAKVMVHTAVCSACLEVAYILAMGRIEKK